MPRGLARPRTVVKPVVHHRLPPKGRTRSLPGSARADPGANSGGALAKWSASSDTLLADLRKTFAPRVDRTQLLLQLATRYLLVGTCDSQFGSGVAKFLPEKVIYSFEHPLHRHVEMHMSYEHMLNARAHRSGGSGGSGGSREFRFRIGRQLEYFTREYDPQNEAHELRIGFATDADFARFRQTVLPHVEALAR